MNLYLKYNLDNLVVIVDRNKLQITGKTEDVNPIEPLKDKFNSFGLATKEVDGNSVYELNEVLSNTPFEKNKVNVPQIENFKNNYSFNQSYSIVKQWKDSQLIDVNSIRLVNAEFSNLNIVEQ